MKIFCVLCLCLAGFTSFSQSGLLSQTSEVHNLLVNFEADYGSLERFYFINNSPERRERMKSFYSDYLTRLNALPFDDMSVGGKVDFILFRRDLQSRLYSLAQEEKEVNQLPKLISQGEPIYAAEKKRRRGEVMNWQDVAKQLNDCNKTINSEIDKLPSEPNYTKAIAARAEGIVKGQRKALKSFFEFYDGYDPQFTWWVMKPYEKLDITLMRYADLLRKKVDPATLPKDDSSGIIGNPIGREELIRQLQYEMIPYSPEDLVDIANKEFAWCDAELLKASKEMGFGNDWKAAQEKVKMSFVPEGHQPEAMYKLYQESVDFLKKHDLITIPPLAEETWRMSMMSPRQQLVSPFFLGGEVLQISYPTDEMNHDDKLMSMRGNNPHFSRSTVHHELIAGHHLQGFMNDRYKAYRSFYTPFWTEGWALYQEFVLWDLGFPRGPEDRIGMLFWRMHRCARIIFSLNYHLGKWTPKQCIDFLVDRVGHERANAEGEVRRSFTGNYGPLYQLAYMVGGLQFYAMKKELVDSGKMTYKQYHDAVIHENAMPVEMVRAIITNQPPKKDFISSWKFYTK
ncbi:MAG TPA: DUF885 family protein [Cyclobacteriaceae bacterium]